MKRSDLVKLIKELSSTGTGASASTGSGEGIATKNFLKRKLNEVSSRSYNKQVSATPKQKAKNAFGLVRKKLNEIDAILEYSNKLKEEVGTNWALNEKQQIFINEKMRSISTKLKKISK